MSSLLPHDAPRVPLAVRVESISARLPFGQEAAAQMAPIAAQFSFRDRSIDFEQLEVRVGEKRMPLTLMEAALLRYFVQREGCPVLRKAILEEVWGLRDDTDTRAIDNFIVRPRRYIEDDPRSPRHLQTVRGVGYRFVAKPLMNAKCEKTPSSDRRFSGAFFLYAG